MKTQHLSFLTPFLPPSFLNNETNFKVSSSYHYPYCQRIGANP